VGVLGLALQRFDGVVTLGLDGVGRVDLEHEVDAAAQVEAELDRALQRVLDRRTSRAGPLLLGVRVAHEDVTGDRAEHHQKDQQNAPAELLTQDSPPKKNAGVYRKRLLVSSC